MKEIIIKYLTDTITIEELTALHKWLKKPEHQKQFKELVKVNQRLDMGYQKIDSEKAFNRILSEITQKRSKVKHLYKRAFKYAAIAILLIATGIGVYTIVQPDTGVPSESFTNTAPEITLELEDGTVKVLDENSRSSISNAEGEVVVDQEYDKLLYKDEEESATAALEFNKLTVPYGKRFKLELSDGTIVFLNAGTTIRYPRFFSDPESRQVYLNGEAYFKVTRNEEQPFIVNTEEMNVQVLGTRFNVSSYGNENNTSVVLEEGSVGVYEPFETFNKEENIIITPGQQAVIQNEIFTVQEVNVEKHIAWTEGRLYFVNDRFEVIIRELERHYNIRIENNYPELNNARYTGTFLTETIIEVLNTFKENTQFEYKIEGDVVIIQPSF